MDLFLEMCFASMKWGLGEWLLVLGFLTCFGYIIGDFLKFVKDVRNGKYDDFFGR